VPLTYFRDIAGVLAGFLSAWILSELTEWRKTRRLRDGLRQAMVVELERAEVRLSTAVAKYAYVADTPDVVARVAAELRWFLAVGETRVPGTGVTLADARPEMLARFRDQPDAVLVSTWAEHTARETVGNKYTLPILDSILSGHLEVFPASQVQALSELGSQMQMLGQEADWTAEFLRQTFTLTDPDNHAIALQNHDRRVRAYALRARVALDCVRDALRAFGTPSRYPVSRRT
jgi:hypothetical protein